MVKESIIFFGMVLSIGLVSCGSGSTNETTTMDSSLMNMHMMDSTNNRTEAPTQDMGDSTGGSSTNAGDSVRGAGGRQ